MNRLDGKNIIVREHGKANPILVNEENLLLETIDQALSTTSRAQSIGKNGEIPLIAFLKRYLPYSFNAVTGYFISPSGRLSPPTDILILDARYPLLAENSDGTVLAMLHSVVHTISVRTRITALDISQAWEEAFEILKLVSEVDRFDGDLACSICSYVLAYRTSFRLDTLNKTFASLGEPSRASLDISILRLSKKDQINATDVGVELRYEPVSRAKFAEDSVGYIPTSRVSYTLLSDIYYNLVQNGYSSLASRNYNFADISRHLGQYMTWSTCPWDEFFIQAANREKH